MEATIINDVTTYDDRLTYQELQKLCHDQVESIRTLENYMIDLESTNRILMSEVQTLKNREVIYEDEVKSLTSANIEKDEYIDYLNGILNESLEALQMMKQKYDNEKTRSDINPIMHQKYKELADLLCEELVTLEDEIDSSSILTQGDSPDPYKSNIGKVRRFPTHKSVLKIKHTISPAIDEESVEEEREDFNRNGGIEYSSSSNNISDIRSITPIPAIASRRQRYQEK